MIKKKDLSSIDPLESLFKKYQFKSNDIGECIFGKTYVAVVLKNGNIGLSANLDNIFETSIMKTNLPDLNKTDHRLILNAYYNAKLNYKDNGQDSKDLFEEINFNSYRNIIMIGYSLPMLNKLDSKETEIHIFDHSKDDSILVDQSLLKEYLKGAECVILTATTIVNNTFTEIVNNSGANCDIFLVGPSTPMTKEMFKYKNVKALFGTVFKKNDHKITDIIKEGEGTRVFKHLGKKVALINNYSGSL